MLSCKAATTVQPNINWYFLGQSLITKLVVILDYNLTQYLFIGGEF